MENKLKELECLVSKMLKKQSSAKEGIKSYDFILAQKRKLEEYNELKNYILKEIKNKGLLIIYKDFDLNIICDENFIKIIIEPKIFDVSNLDEIYKDAYNRHMYKDYEKVYNDYNVLQHKTIYLNVGYYTMCFTNKNLLDQSIFSFLVYKHTDIWEKVAKLIDEENFNFGTYHLKTVDPDITLTGNEQYTAILTTNYNTSVLSYLDNLTMEGIYYSDNLEVVNYIEKKLSKNPELFPINGKVIDEASLDKNTIESYIRYRVK